MLINPVNTNIQVNKPDEVLGNKPKTLKNHGENNNFGELVNRAINSVNDAQTEANQQVSDFVSGKTDNVHEVMIAMEKAQLSFQLMTEIRNKLVETYQELSRMQM